MSIYIVCPGVFNSFNKNLVASGFPQVPCSCLGCPQQLFMFRKAKQEEQEVPIQIIVQDHFFWDKLFLAKEQPGCACV